MSNEEIYEKIGLTVDEANECWDYDCVNELCDFQDPGTVLSIFDLDICIYFRAKKRTSS